MNRRAFLQIGWTALGAAAALLGIRLTSFAAVPADGGQTGPIDLGKAADYQAPGIHPVDGGRFFIRSDGQTYTALSSRCTHLGCRVRYDSSQNQFFCPCHGSHYDREGRPISGPAPKPLETYAVTIDKNGNLILNQIPRGT